MPRPIRTRPASSWPHFLAWFVGGTVIAGIPVSLLAWFYYLGGTRWAHAAVVLPLAFGVGASEASLLRAPRLRTSVVAAMLLIALLAWASVGNSYWRWTLGAQQIENLGLLQAYGRALENHREIHGHYPDSLLQALAPRSNRIPDSGCDRWGYPVHYEARHEAYVLVSPGRGGSLDPVDPWELRERYAATRLMINICGDWRADHVLSDLGIVQGCGK